MTERNKILKEIDEPTKGNYKNIYLYSYTKLPTNGWLQGCDNCGTITSKIMLIYNKLYKKKMYNFYVFRCPSRKKKDKDSLLQYNNYIDECMDYIKREFRYIF